MKKLVLIFGLILACGVARADVSVVDSLKKIPAMKQGVAYSLEDSQLNYLTTMDIVQKFGFNLEAGFAADAEKTGYKAVAVLSYDLWNAKEKGVTIPILDLIDLRPGIYVGFGRIEGFQDSKLKGEGDYGISITAINLKF